MSEVDIFNSAKPQEGSFFSFKNIGDSIQGTYIAKRDAVNKFGNDQIIYVITDIEGKVWNVAFNKTATITHERMSGIRFGQIVGFKFEEERAPKTAGRFPTKIIRIYADPKYVDHGWLEQQKQIEAQYSGTGVAPVASPVRGTAEVEDEDDGFGDAFTAPAEAGPAKDNLPTGEVAKPVNEALKAIRNLAVTKGLTTEAMPEAEADAAIEAYTKLTLNDENFTKIIIALTGYVKS